jgi:hypothetical protein
MAVDLRASCHYVGAAITRAPTAAPGVLDGIEASITRRDLLPPLASALWRIRAAWHLASCISSSASSAPTQWATLGTAERNLASISFTNNQPALLVIWNTFLVDGLFT